MIFEILKEFGVAGLTIGFAWYVTDRGFRQYRELIDKVIEYNKAREDVLYDIIRDDLKKMQEAHVFQRKEHEEMLVSLNQIADILRGENPEQKYSHVSHV